MLGKTLRGAAVLLVLGTGSSFAASLPPTTENVVIWAKDVLVMANQYLRGGSSAPSIGDVNTAVTMLNQAFDGCRRVVQCR